MTSNNKQTIIPKLRFAEFSNSWKISNLKMMSKKIWIGLVTTMTKNYTHSGTRLIRNSNIRSNKIVDEDPIFLDKTFANQFLNRTVKKGDIVTVHTGDVGTSAIIDSEFDGAHGFATLNTRVNESLLDNKFLCLYFNTDKYRNWAVRYSTGDGRNNLNLSDFVKSQIPMTVLEEQKKVASFIFSVDKWIENLEKQKASLEEYKKGMMQKIFSQEIRFKNEDGNMYPKWEKKKLSSFTNLESGDGDWILTKDISSNGEYKIVQLGNIGFGKYIEKKLKTISKNKFEELNGTPIVLGDLLINRMVDDNVYSCIFEKNGNYITSVDVCWIRKNDYFSNKFLMYLLNLDGNQKKMLSLSSGSGRVRISKNNLFYKFAFLLPCNAEQEKIASFLSSIDNLIESKDKQVINAKEWKKGLLQQMFL